MSGAGELVSLPLDFIEAPAVRPLSTPRFELKHGERPRIYRMPVEPRKAFAYGFKGSAISESATGRRIDLFV